MVKSECGQTRSRSGTALETRRGHLHLQVSSSSRHLCGQQTSLHTKERCTTGCRRLKFCGRRRLRAAALYFLNWCKGKAPQGCGLSAAASADWRGGNAVPLRANLRESDKSWGRRGKAPEKAPYSTASAADVPVIVFSSAADRCDKPDAEVARQSDRIASRLHRLMA